MNPRARRTGTTVPKTIRLKLLTITAAVLLAVAAVVVSVHSSNAPASRERSTAKSVDNPQAPGELKTRHTRGLAPLAPPVSTVTATKTDSLFTDVDGDLQADPGDTLQYSVNISASGDDATGVTFTDTVDPNTAFVPGSLTATPVAVDDSYTATGNIRISVAAPGVLGNDFTGVPAATITAPPSTSTNGGNVSLAADGSFTYNPPAGFEGVDTFTYTLTNASGSNNATVSITVSGMIWFIDNNAPACTTLAAGCGRLTNPFSSLSAFAALNNGSGNNPAANDNIFVYESASDYVGPVTLLSGQRFIGQDATASLSAITGLTPPAGSDPLPTTNSANGTIVNITTGTAITVGTGNTLTGFTGGNSTTDISGTGFGTLTISDVTLNGTGQALNLTTGTLAATFVSISSANSATTGISLTGVAGTLTSPTTTITNPTGIGISVGTSSGTLNFGATTASGSGGTGVSLLTNTGAITFAALNISPDANQRGLLATDNTNTITSTSGAITTSGAIAVEITRATLTTPLVVGLTSVSATGGANGILLRNTSGSFTVNGDGTNTTVGGNASGGTISGMTGADGAIAGSGVYLENATNVSLRRVTINGTNQNFGIRGFRVDNFTLEYSTVNGTNGTSASFDNYGEGSVMFGDDASTTTNGLTGTGTVTNCSISGGRARNFSVVNTAGTLNRLTITGSTFGLNQNFADAGHSLAVEARNSGTVANVTVTGSTFTGSPGDQANFTGQIGTTMDVIFGGATGTPGTAPGNAVSNNHAQNAIGGSNLTLATNGVMDFHVSGNTFRDANGSAITFFKSASGTQQNGFFDNNVIGVSAVTDSGSATGNGIFVVGSGAGTMSYTITDNAIHQINGNAHLFADNTGGSYTANFTIEGNTLDTPSAGWFAGIAITNGAPSSTDTINVCAKIGGASAAEKNTFNVGGNLGVIVGSSGAAAGHVFNLPGFAGSTLADVETFIQGNNAGSFTTLAYEDPPATAAAFTGTGTGCGTPASMPSMLEGGSSSQMSNQPEADQSNSQEFVLRSALGEASNDQNVQNLRQDALNFMIPAAMARWEAAGIASENLARMQAMTFQVADLPNGELASVSGTTVRIDLTAAGHGWFLDQSPMEDSEFDVPVPNQELQTTELSSAHTGMDLLTVVMRALGVAYEQGQQRIPKQLRPLMQNTLSPAVRRLPDARTIQLPSTKGSASSLNRSRNETSRVSQLRKGSARRSKTALSTSPGSIRKVAFNSRAKQTSDRNSRLMHHAPRNITTAPTLSSMLADVMLTIGTLPAGETVTITFKVTVDDPFTGGTPQVSNQGTVSGTNFADVLTDDPTVGGTADPTVTPIDLPQVTLAVSPSSVLEDGATNLVYTFTRTGSTTNAMTVNFSVGGTASFTEPDYSQTGAATFTATSGTVVIPGGSSTATVTIDPSADSTVEPDETVVLTVTSGVGYTVGAPSSASGTITNDDTDVSIAISPASVAEDGATNLVYTFTRNGVTSGALTVNFSVGGTATFGVSPDDYTQTGATTFTTTSGSVTFGAGNSTATVTVNPETDTTIETDETVILTLTSGAGYNVSSPSSATGTITNDDADVSVAVSPASVTEDGATNLVYTFTRTGFTAGALTVNFSVGGTATFGVSPDDYTQTGATTFTTTSGSVTFGAGNSTATVTVNPETDTTAESDETVIITLTAGAGYNAVNPTSATGTILNDDTLVSVAVAPSSTAEGGANLVYTFTRTGPTTSAVTANFSVGGTAAFPADYSQSGATTFTPPTATVTFGVGSSTATVTVTPLSDCTVEGSETVEFTVQPGSGYGVGSPSMATGTITNTPDSSPPTITLIPNVDMTLWPPDHEYESVAVTDFVASASDDCDPTVNVNSVYILKISSDEAEDGAADGSTLNDIIIGASCKTAQLRAERSGSGDGRVYTITFKVKDSSGNFTTATAKVTVRTSPNIPAVDSGPVYTVNSSCP